MASRSNQPFFHNAPDKKTNRPLERQTERQTDRVTDKPTDGPGNETCTNTHLRSINDCDVANNAQSNRLYISGITDAL